MKRNFAKKVGAVTMALAVTTGTLLPVMAQTGYSTGNTGNTEAVIDALNNADIIDYSKKGSLTIRKYDMTAASEIGGLSAIDTESTDFSSGEQNADAESAFSSYEVAGVEFTYVNLGQIETSSKVVDGKNETKLVYEIDEKLRTILGLENTEPEDMATENEANPCVSEGKYHYTASVLEQAIKETNEKGTQAKDKLEAYAKEHGCAMSLTDKDGLTKAENLDLGLYLIVETKVPEQVTSTVDPWLVSLPMTHTDGGSWFYDIYVYPKNQTGNPTLEKLVRNAEGENAEDASNTAQNHSYIVSEYNKDEKYVTDRKEFKYDSSTTASEGDILDYILVSKLPHITSTSTYLTEYVFKDSLSKGIEYDKDSIQIAFYDSNPQTWADDVKAHKPGSEVGDVKTYDADVNGEDAKSASVNDLTKAKAVWNVTSDNKLAEVITSDNKDDLSTLTVSVTKAGLDEINTKYSDCYMVVYYQAKVNSNDTAVLGDEGNPNDVKLTWRRTSEGFYDTLEDKAVVFTYGLDITKTFSDNKGNAENVQFTLYNMTDGYYVTADETETVGNNKIYYVTGKTDQESEATRFVPNEKGKLLVYGIEGDKYELTETATDKKYNLLKDPVVIDIKSATQDIESAVAGWDGMTLNDEDRKNLTSGEGRPAGKIAMAEGDVQSATATVDAKAVSLGKSGTSQSAVVGMSILNSKSWFMPKTGGYGIRILPIAGLMIAGAGIVLTRGKKKEEKEQA